jgi:hypothetical protein
MLEAGAIRSVQQRKVAMRNYQPVTHDTFILRVWRESASGTWRGQIVHLPGQESIYFATLAQAEAFIAQFVPGLTASGAHGREDDGSLQCEKQDIPNDDG